MFHNITEMYRDLKYQDTLQVSYIIQNLKTTESSSRPYPDQPSEQNIPGNLQEVPPNLQDVQFHPKQV